MHDPEIGRWHLPGCMGAAVYGPEGCTCPSTSEEDHRNELETRIASLEERLERLERRKPA
jgi:hypothetical protein